MARYVDAMRGHSPAGSCGYCGTFGGQIRLDGTGKLAHPATTCLHCGIRVCMAVTSKCPRCFVGLLAGWSGHGGSCQRAKCDRPRAAFVRKRYVCSEHAGPLVISDPKTLSPYLRLVEVPDEREAS